MSGRTLLIVLLVSLLLTAALWYFSGGRIWFLGCRWCSGCRC